MSLLPTPPQAYDANNEAQTRRIIEQRYAGTRKLGQDVELAPTERLIMTSPDGTRWAVTINNAGALVSTAL